MKVLVEALNPKPTANHYTDEGHTPGHMCTPTVQCHSALHCQPLI